jgi:predicted alpha-1,2-mannosidase
MRRFAAAIVCGLLVASLLPGTAVAETQDLAAYVDPLIGTSPPGFVNPGPVMPHGLVGLGPDTEGPVNYGGYHYVNNTITGFSHIHTSAGVFRGGQIPVMPVAGDVQLGDPVSQIPGLGPEASPIPAYASPFNHGTETAEAGYYKVLLERYGIQAELTATERVGVHRYSFPPGLPASIVFDPARNLDGYANTASVSVADGMVSGHIDSNDDNVKVFFAATFDQPVVSAQTFKDAAFSDQASQEGSRVGAVVTFDPGSVVEMKVGISFTDLNGALTNLEAETTGRSFDDIHAAARAAWNNALNLVQVEGGTDAEKTSFYTAMYHALFFPNLFSDADGRYRGFDDVTRPSDFDHYSQFSLWDSYRGQNQLLAVVEPDRYRDMTLSLLDMYRQSGKLPRWTFANRDPGHMSGNPVIPFIGEGWCRGVLSELTSTEKDELLAAMKERSVNNPGGNYDELGYAPVPKLGTYPGGIPQIDQLHDGGGGNAGTTLEYGVADFSLALMADSRAVTDERDRLLERSLYYRNLLDPETRWIRPRDEDGTWLKEFVPENDYGFQEGTSWQYSWLAMQDLAGVIERMGGREAVQQRLDTFFNLPASGTLPVVWPKAQNQATAFGLLYAGNQYAPGNEHDLEAPFVYNYAGAPWKTQAVTRGAVSLFTPTPDGLPGNDDLGALSGWLVWAMLGVYPMTPGAPMYTVASPVFEKATIHRPGREDLVIEAPGASAVSRYIQSATLDEHPLDKTWFEEDEGSVLRLELGPVPNMEWAADEPPPSLSSDPDLDHFGCVDQRDAVTPVATSLTYVGDTQGRGTSVRLAARLIDAEGLPLVGQTITFDLQGTPFTGTTGADGLAEVVARVTGHGRTQHVTATFAGTEAYLGSTAQADIVWGQPL